MKYNYFLKKSKLNGSVKISGAKNAVLKLMTASLLTDEKVIINNYPNTLSDAVIHEEMLRALGRKVSTETSILTISESEESVTDLIWDGRSIRNTLLMLGCLVTKYGRGAVPLPGGCKLGERKYDIHVSVLEALGAKVFEDGNYLVAEVDGRLKGARIDLPMRSTGATENAILAASLAEGVTEIYNPHIRPEIIDLVNMLKLMGANIEVHGQEKIVVSGVSALSGVTYEVIPDNMEALTWLVAAAITDSTIEIENFPFDDLEVPLIFLRESGVKIFRHKNTAIIKDSNVYPIDISTGPYPGINSDMQPIFAAFASCAEGVSNIVDLRFLGRYGYAEEFSKLGVDCSVSGNALKITGHGKSVLKSGEVTALDLRAGIALALLGLLSDDGVLVHNSWQIERGYDQFFEKLTSLGANVERCPAE
ncbi:UDP-N-acetylglucosamine 1-carboxyvinyltransferase [Vibrio lentus]|uniref:UDP-N-acetylglucosamine 1-carboxyvinyltransferase n=1 Tax=Vibrio lentus TaxID=136468 RepID=UPI002468CDBC|nr:UDP-N-acetylglucosamine 1-carboxyvinyltransferase [Vibrio lentus]MDH5929430.1 UDP-N-acetylglucosamine 1-carboxyvinyltransferase [Vibrio lentus]